MKCVDTGGSASLDHRLAEDDEAQSLYQSPSSSLPSSSTFDADTRCPAVAWHTPRASPGTHDVNTTVDVTEERALEDHLGIDDQDDPTAAAASAASDNVVEKHLNSVWIPRELTSRNVTTTPTEVKTSDVKRGKYVFC